MEMSLSFIAGTLSTTIFALSTLPMVLKAYQTKDLRSYSLGNILLANLGNVIHSVYVFSLPPGPIWLLHSFYLVTTGLMLIWYLRYEWLPMNVSRIRRKDTNDISMNRSTRLTPSPARPQTIPPYDAPSGA